MISYATLLAASGAAAHVVVDAVPTDAVTLASFRVAVVAIIVSVVTLAAVLFQIWLAKRTLDATEDELKLSNAQLAEAQKASEQTRQALALTQQQIELSRQDAVSSTRRAAPRVVAEIRDETFENVPQTHGRSRPDIWGGLSSPTLIPPGVMGTMPLAGRASTRTMPFVEQAGTYFKHSCSRWA